MPNECSHPEVWHDGYWRYGSAYVVDAITGMGEDVWSSGECADPWDEEKATAYTEANKIDLFCESSL